MLIKPKNPYTIIKLSIKKRS